MIHARLAHVELLEVSISSSDEEERFVQNQISIFILKQWLTLASLGDVER